VKRLFFALLLVGLPQCSSGDVKGDAGSDGGGDGDAGGGCPHDCLGGACVAGACQAYALVTKLNGPINLAQMSDRVFWTDYSLTDATRSDVGSVDKATGTFKVLAGYPLIDAPWGIAADDTNVYVVNASGPSTILRCTPDQCDQTSVFYDNALQPTVVALAGSYAYWMEPFVDSISRMPKTGGTAEQVAQPNTSAANGQFACIASDSTYIYWSEPDNDVIMRQAIGGQQPETVFTLPTGSYPAALWLDSGVLYFTAGGTTVGSGFIGYGNPDGTGGPQMLATKQRTPWTVVTDATYAYWTNEGDFDQNNNPLDDGSVMRCEKAGCTTPVVLASNLADPHGIVVDDTAIYFATTATSTGDGTIWRLAK